MGRKGNEFARYKMDNNQRPGLLNSYVAFAGCKQIPGMEFLFRPCVV